MLVAIRLLTLGIITGSSPIATQIPHAAGIAYAMQYRGEDAVVGCWFGDGATSEGDWHEGLNFAGIHRLPVVWYCENNRYAISVPLSKQMAVANVADRASAYGFEGVVVEGNDVLACYEASKRAIDKARAGGVPTRTPPGRRSLAITAVAANMRLLSYNIHKGIGGSDRRASGHSCASRDGCRMAYPVRKGASVSRQVKVPSRSNTATQDPMCLFP